MKSIYFDLNIPKLLLTQLLSIGWKKVYYSPIAPVSFRELEDRELPGPRWVRIRNRLAGICGSDLSVFFLKANPKIALAALPGLKRVFLGHEIIGEVVEVGQTVEHLRPGDRVVLQKALPCCFSKEIEPLCQHCRAGNYSICVNQSEGQPPKTIGGGWSEFVIGHESQFVLVPSDISDDHAVLIEPAAVALRAVLRKAPQPDDQILIVGTGVIGLLILHVLKKLYPQCRVSIIARHIYQQEKAEALGADHILSEKDLYPQIARITKAYHYTGMFKNQTLLGGYDKIFDCVGNGETIHHSLRWCRAGGTVILVGVDLNPSKFDYTPNLHQEIDLISSYCHGNENDNEKPISTFAFVIKLLQAQQLSLDGLITHRFRLEDYQRALTIVTKKSESHVIKAVFEFQ